MEKISLSDAIFLGIKARPLQYFGNYFTNTETKCFDAAIKKSKDIYKDNRGIEYIGSCALGAAIEGVLLQNDIDCFGVAISSDKIAIERYLFVYFPQLKNHIKTNIDYKVTNNQNKTYEIYRLRFDGTLYSLITTLNEVYRWKRDRIARILRTLGY